MLRRRTCLLWIVLTLSLGTLALVVVLVKTLAQPPDPSRTQALFTARDTWTRRPFTSYRLEIEQEGTLQPRCQQEIEVRDDHVTNVITNTCAGEVITIPDLFARIEEYTTNVICGPNGCECDGRVIAHARYDPALGYPRSLAISLERQPRLLAWLPSFNTGCTMVGFYGGPTITVVTLTPLP